MGKKSSGVLGLVASTIAVTTAHAGTVGLYSCASFGAQLFDFPKNTTYLEYVTLDTDARTKAILHSVTEIIPTLEANRIAQLTRDKSLNLQIGIQIHNHSLVTFIAELGQPDSALSKSVRALGEQLAQEKQTVYVRPFSEMNDLEPPGPDAGWKLDPQAGPDGNSPENYAKAWIALHDALTRAGLKNANYHFNVLAAKNVGIDESDDGNKEVTFKALELIPVGYVDSFGLNAYARPINAPWAASPVDPEKNPIGTLTEDYVPFATIAQPWLDRLQKSPIFSKLPVVVGEAGCSNQGTDAKKMLWIQQSFEYSRKNQFAMFTYFNCNRYNWAALPWSTAERELKNQLSLGL